MGKPTPSAPQAANPSQVAQQQSQANINTAIGQATLNNTNQVTPYGNLTYSETGGRYTPDGTWVPQYTATQTLSPEQQKLYDAQTQVSQGTTDLANQYVSRIADATSTPYSYDSLGPAPTYNDDSAAKYAQTLISRDQPQQDRDLANLTQRLANQGISVGTPAYQAAMDQYQRSVNDYRLGAQSQGQTMAMNDYNTSENAYQNAISQYTNLRTEPINEVATLLGTGTGVQSPSYVSTPQTQVAPTDVTGAYNNAYQQQLAAYQTQQQQNAATTGGLFGLGGTVLGLGGLYALGGPAGSAFGASMGAGVGKMLSDERAKTDIEPVGRLDNGLPVYRFRYKGDPTPQIGLLAQDVEKINPDAVHTLPGGLKAVDYMAATAGSGGLYALGKALADA